MQPERAIHAVAAAVALAAWLFGTGASAQSPHGRAPTGTAANGGPAQVPEIFRDADLALGEKLLRDNRCAECHARQVGGDGSAIYRPAGKVNTPGALRGMVDYCSNELNLGWFPEDVTAVAAVLQRDHYRFAPGAAPTAKAASAR